MELNIAKNEVNMLKYKEKCMHSWTVVRTIQRTKETKVKKAREAFEKSKQAGVPALVYRQKECQREGCAGKLITVELRWKKLEHLIDEHDELKEEVESQSVTLRSLTDENKKLKSAIKNLEKKLKLAEDQDEDDLDFSQDMVSLENEKLKLENDLEKAKEFCQVKTAAVNFLLEKIEARMPKLYTELLRDLEILERRTDKAPVKFEKVNPFPVQGGSCSSK